MNKPNSISYGSSSYASLIKPIGKKKLVRRTTERHAPDWYNDMLQFPNGISHPSTNNTTFANSNTVSKHISQKHKHKNIKHIIEEDWDNSGFDKKRIPMVIKIKHTANNLYTSVQSIQENNNDDPSSSNNIVPTTLPSSDSSVKTKMSFNFINNQIPSQFEILYIHLTFF